MAKMPPYRRSSARVGWIFVFLVFGAWVLSALAVFVWGRRDAARPVGAIVVLGAAQYDGRPSPVLRARLDHALALWDKGLATRFVVTGGVGAGDTTSEAAVSRRYAIRHGVPPEAILMEPLGRTTRESIHLVATVLRAERRDSVILVSDPFHMLRVSVLARRHGLTPFSSPTRTSPISANRRQVVGYLISESVKAPVAFILERPGS